MALVQPQQQGFDNSRLYMWVKGLESKVNNLIREVDVIKNDFIRKHNNIKKEIKDINEDLLEVKRGQDKVQQKMDLVVRELKRTAGIEEVQTLKKYVEFWNPMNFVTQRDLDKAIESKLHLVKASLRKTTRKKRSYVKKKKKHK